jgi:hypothetical protein
MKSRLVFLAMVTYVMNVSGCSAHDDVCNGMVPVSKDRKAIESLVNWVDGRSLNNTLGKENAVPDKTVFRPGRYSIATDFDYKAFGFSEEITARVLQDKQKNIASVFIGDSPSNGIIVRLSKSKDFGLIVGVTHPTNNARVLIVCSGRSRGVLKNAP